MQLRSALLVFILTTGALADTIVVKEGTSYAGIIICITEQSILLKDGRETFEFQRTSVEEITFTKSDLVVLTSRDTLRGKVLRMGHDGFVVAREKELRVVQPGLITDILYSAGTSLRLREITHTDDTFRFEELPVEKERSPIFLCAYVGGQDVSYAFAGNRSYYSPSFEKTIRGRSYGVEGGVLISPAIALTVGAYWYRARTEVQQGTDVGQPSYVGYSGAYLSALFNLLPEARLSPFLRIQLAIQHGQSPPDVGNAMGSVVPGIGLSFALNPFVQIYCELDRQSAELPLNSNEDVIDIEGFVILAGFRMHLPTSASTSNRSFND